MGGQLYYITIDSTNGISEYTIQTIHNVYLVPYIVGQSYTYSLEPIFWFPCSKMAFHLVRNGFPVELNSRNSDCSMLNEVREVISLTVTVVLMKLEKWVSYNLNGCVLFYAFPTYFNHFI